MRARLPWLRVVGAQLRLLGVAEEAAERLPPEEEEESQEHGEGWPVLCASCGRHIKSAGADEAGR